MSKLFVLSDVHGYYDEMKAALDEAGFDENNPEHWLIGLGDYIDRGTQPTKVISYLHNLPRKVLIRGNHTKLFEDCCYRGEPWSHDYSNGTARTIWDIAYLPGYVEDFPEMCDYALKRTKAFRDSMVNYFETKNYIFVHSWVPVINEDGLPAHYTKGRRFSFNPDWRNASQKEYDDATWGNPFAMAAQGLNQTGKTIVFGHWATEHKWAEVEGRRDFDSDAKFDIYYGDGIIGIDGCTAYSGRVNVLVLEDEFIN
jgi:serine/threonine protein phosphatase 1